MNMGKAMKVRRLGADGTRSRKVPSIAKSVTVEHAKDQ
jgi:hypothetical protein